MAFELHAGFTSAIATDPAATAAGYLTPDRYNLAHVVTGADVGGIPYCPTATTIATSANLTYAASTGEGLVVDAGTATTDLNAFRLTQTMNAAAVAFTGSKWTFTEGASGTAAGTLLFDVWYGTSGAEASMFRIDKSGNCISQLNFQSYGGHLLLRAANSFVGGTSGGTMGFSSSAIDNVGTNDTAISRISAGVIGVGTGAQGSFAGSLQLTGIELGHASDTTLSRSSAGVLAVEGVVIPSISSTNTLTNKRLTKRVTTETSSATPTINTDNCDMHTITALAANITSFTTNLSGTPTNGQALLIRITDDASGPYTISWGASFVGSTGLALPATTTDNKTLYAAFIWNSTAAIWQLSGTIDGFAP